MATGALGVGRCSTSHANPSANPVAPLATDFSRAANQRSMPAGVSASSATSGSGSRRWSRACNVAVTSGSATQEPPARPGQRPEADAAEEGPTGQSLHDEERATEQAGVGPEEQHPRRRVTLLHEHTLHRGLPMREVRWRRRRKEPHDEGDVPGGRGPGQGEPVVLREVPTTEPDR